MSKRKQQNGTNNINEPRRSQRVKQKQKNGTTTENGNGSLNNNNSSNSNNNNNTASSNGSIKSNPYYNSDDEFPVLRRLGLYASDIKGDGNCMFRAMGDQLYGDGGKSHVQIRAQIVGYMKEHIDYFGPFISVEGENWQQYLRRMSQDSIWGDNLEIVAFANCFKANVVIYQRDSCYVIAPSHDPANAKQLHIAYHEWEHYSSVRNKSGPHNGIPRVSPRSTPLEGLKSDLDSAPDYRVDIVQKSLPYFVSVDVVRERLQKNDGDISSTVEELLFEEGVVDEPEVKKVATSEKVIDDDDERDENVESKSSSSSPSKDKKKNDKKKKKLTAREKKDKQKEEALERKREKKRQLRNNDNDNDNNESIANNNSMTPEIMNNTEGIKTMYI